MVVFKETPPKWRLAVFLSLSPKNRSDFSERFCFAFKLQLISDFKGVIKLTLD